MSRIVPPSKTQTPVSLTLTFSPATSALSPISDLTRPFYFPSRCQPPLGFSSVVDRLKSQSWFLCTSDPPSNVSSKPALQQNSHLWPLLLLPVRWTQLAGEKPHCHAILCADPRSPTFVRPLVPLVRALLAQFSFSHPLHHHSKHSWLSSSSVFKACPQAILRLFFFWPHWNN